MRPPLATNRFDGLLSDALAFAQSHRLLMLSFATDAGIDNNPLPQGNIWGQEIYGNGLNDGKFPRRIV